ncbi:hypothetical protein COOONC_21059 [Cooperia oncophora]
MPNRSNRSARQPVRGNRAQLHLRPDVHYVIEKVRSVVYRAVSVTRPGQRRVSEAIRDHQPSSRTSDKELRLCVRAGAVRSRPRI